MNAPSLGFLNTISGPMSAKGGPTLVEAFRVYSKPAKPVVVAVRGLGVDGEPHPTTIKRAFDDVAIVYPANGAPFAISFCTHPWQETDGRGGRPAKAFFLPVGRYKAGPARSDSHGYPSPKGKPHFTVMVDGAPFVMVDAHGSRMTVGIYPEPLMSPHLGCQVLRPADWGAFVKAVGGLQATFDYVLVALTRTP